jgi:hypothetical protein
MLVKSREPLRVRKAVVRNKTTKDLNQHLGEVEELVIFIRVINVPMDAIARACSPRTRRAKTMPKRVTHTFKT